MPEAAKVRECWEKACDCKSTSSGPRQAIIFEPYVGGESLKFRLEWHRIVCDLCEKPWTKTGESNGRTETDVHEGAAKGGV